MHALDRVGCAADQDPGQNFSMTHRGVVDKQAQTQTRDNKGKTHLLGVDSTLEVGHFVALVDGAQENGLELVHTSVGEEQGGIIVGHDRRRGHCREAKVSIKLHGYCHCQLPDRYIPMV